VYFTITRGCLKEIILVFNFMLFTSWTYENFTGLQCSVAESIVIFRCSLHRCGQCSAFEQECVFPPGKNCPSSAAPGAQHYAVPRFWHNGVMAGFFQTGDNLMVQCQDTLMSRQQVVRYADCFRKE
jgi:hypothetical protein